jgi:hypothetical protein
VIVAFAGRRPGAEDFPEEHVPEVAERVEQLLAGLSPSRVVGSAAAGADLLVLEAAERLDIDADVVIAGDVEAFRASSVADKGEGWVRRYDHAVGVSAPESLTMGEDPDAAYRAVTARIGELAAERAEAADEALVVLVIARPREDADHSEDLAQHANSPGRLLLRIDPSLRAEDRDRAFVAMPFGTDKPYPEQNWSSYDADATYGRVMLPALLDAGYAPLRADTDALLEIIDHTMLREINRAPVMLADLAMLNPNVMWELGLRHAWRRSGTVLLAPQWVKHPFDVARVPIMPYRREPRGIADADAVTAIAALRDLLRDVGRQAVDSPVFANINDLEEVRLPDPPATVRDRAGQLLEAATRAGDRGSAKDLLDVAERVRAAQDLSPHTRSVLLEQIGLRLLPLDRYEDATTILEPLVRADETMERRVLQEQYAHALIRAMPGSVDPERLARATGILRALHERYGVAGESLGLLGSAAKLRVEQAVREGQHPPRAFLMAAIRAYREGLESDPGAWYPGINAVALLRLSGQRWDGGTNAVDEARALLPIVRFAASRPSAQVDIWARLTVAECRLHAHLLTGDTQELRDAERAYAEAASDLRPRERTSARRQLQLMRDAGDPPEAIDPLLEVLT